MTDVLMVDSLIGNDYTIALCTGLAAQGVNVQLVVPHDRIVEPDIAFPVIHLAPSKQPGVNRLKKSLQYVTYLLQLLWLIFHSRPQVVHFQFLRRERLDTLFLCLLRLLPVPVVYTAHNVLPHENGRIDTVLKQLVYTAVDGILIHSRYIQRKLLDAFRVDAAKTCVIPHGNFSLYVPDEPIEGASARQQLGLGPEDRVLLFFGYIRPYKGLELLIDAFTTAAARDPHLKLVIAGKPQNEQLAEQYAQQIQATSVAGRILFHDRFIPFEEVALYFTAADLVVLPYKAIDHSGIMHLAYSFGKPIICTPVGDFPEVIEQGKSGFVLQSSDAACLVDGITTAFSDMQLLAQMGTYARNLGKTRYSWNEIARRTLHFYETIAGRQPQQSAELEEVPTK